MGSTPPISDHNGCDNGDRDYYRFGFGHNEINIDLNARMEDNDDGDDGDDEMVTVSIVDNKENVDGDDTDDDDESGRERGGNLNNRRITTKSNPKC